MNIADKGLGRKQVVFICEGDRQSATTDSQGDATCPFNPLTAPTNGTELRITAHISGISEIPVMHIIQRKIKTTAEIARDKKNNRRAKRFFLATIAVWLLFAGSVLWFGSGEPLVNLHRTELTEQQQLLNSTPGIKGGPLEVKTDIPVPIKELWQKPTLLALLMWTVFVAIYCPLSLREEVIEAFREGVQKIVDRRGYSASVSDPFFQRLAAYAGMLKTARKEVPVNPAQTPAQLPTPATTPATPSGSGPFWQRFKASFLADFLVDALPGILRKLFI